MSSWTAPAKSWVQGYHRRKGEAHAEVNALAAAGPRARDGTAVVTLEPCNHYGRTPPCSQALLDARISRVVVALLDPTSRGEGGVAVLRAGGVSVEVGVLEDEALLVLGDWRRSLDSGPQVTWVYALSAAGEPIPPPPGSAAADDAARLCQLSDVVVYDDLTLSEGVPGGHEWNLPKAAIEEDSYGPDVLGWLATCGARTVVILGSSRAAACFVDCGLVDRDRHLPSIIGALFAPGQGVGGICGPCRLPSDRGGPFHRVGALDRQGEDLTLRHGSERSRPVSNSRCSFERREMLNLLGRTLRRPAAL